MKRSCAFVNCRPSTILLCSVFLVVSTVSCGSNENAPAAGGGSQSDARGTGGAGGGDAANAPQAGSSGQGDAAADLLAKGPDLASVALDSSPSESGRDASYPTLSPDADATGCGKIPAGAVFSDSYGCACALCGRNGIATFLGIGCSSLKPALPCQSQADCSSGACIFEPGCSPGGGHCVANPSCSFLTGFTAQDYCGCDGQTFLVDVNHAYPDRPYSHLGACP